MTKAVDEVRAGRMEYKKAVKAFSVPRATLKDYVKSSLSLTKCVNKTVGRAPVLSVELENLLVTYCLDMEQRYYGLTKKDQTICVEWLIS